MNERSIRSGEEEFYGRIGVGQCLGLPELLRRRAKPEPSHSQFLTDRLYLLSIGSKSRDAM